MADFDTEFCRSLGRVIESLDPPDDYFCIDTESLGYAPADFIVELGHMFVAGGDEVVTTFSRVLDWTIYDRRTNVRLLNSIARMRRGLKEQPGREALLELCSYSYLVEHGDPAKDVLATEYRILEEVRNNGWWVCGTALEFDQRILAGNFGAYLGIQDFGFDWNRLLDVGVIYKAAQDQNFKHPEESNGSYMHRARYAKSSHKWNLELLAELFEVNDEGNSHHRALNDCEITHQIYQRMRQVMRTDYSDDDQELPIEQPTIIAQAPDKPRRRRLVLRNKGLR